MNKSYKTCLYYNSSCLLYAASRPITVSILRSRRVYLGRFVLPIMYTPEKQMFSGVYWNQHVGPSVHVKTITGIGRLVGENC